MAWVHADVAEHYEEEERAIAKHEMRKLRAHRRELGERVMARYLGGIAFPCRYADLLAGWLKVADGELRTREHMGKRSALMPGFGRRFLDAQLARLGYTIAGKVRRDRHSTSRKDFEGCYIYTCRTLDERIVTAPPAAPGPMVAVGELI